MNHKVLYSICVLLLWCLMPCVAIAETYTNPLGPFVADPWIMKYGEFYYVYGTACPGAATVKWIPVFKSRDMVNWSGPYKIFSSSEGCHWAPEGYHYDGYYYAMTTRFRRQQKKPFLLVRSKSVLGPYTDYAAVDNKPGMANDINIFVDTDGKSYLLYKHGQMHPLSSDWKTIGNLHKYKIEGMSEGPYMVKHNNRYNIFGATTGSDKSGRNRGYYLVMGYSDSVFGPYTLWGSKESPVYYGDYRPGHGGYTSSPDGSEMWLTSHYDYRQAGFKWEHRKLAIDYWGGFDSDGWPHKVTQTKGVANNVPSRAIINGNIAASGKSVNASDYSGSNLPSYAINGDSRTIWESGNGSLGKWLEVDLAGEFKIKELTTMFNSEAAYKYAIQGSYDRYNWTMLVDNESNTTSAQTFTDIVNESSYFRYIRISISEFPGAETCQIQEVQIINDNQDQFINYSDTLTLQAENWSSSSRALKIETCTDINGGDNLTDTNIGEWIAFDNIDIPSDGTYDIEFRVASDDHENNWKFYDNGRLIATEHVGHTDGWQKWASLHTYDVSLTAGKHSFKLEFLDDGNNFNWIKIRKVNRANDITSPHY